MTVCLTEATRLISSKSSRPTAAIVAVPLTMRPALRSMSSTIRENISVLEAILINGVGLPPKTDPRPVVKHTTVAHPR